MCLFRKQKELKNQLDNATRQISSLSIKLSNANNQINELDKYIHMLQAKLDEHNIQYENYWASHQTQESSKPNPPKGFESDDYEFRIK